MTATHTGSVSFLTGLLPALRQMGRWLSRGLLGLAIVLMAGILTIATAAAGIVLAALALIMRLSGTSAERDKTHFDARAEGEGLTLEARKTPRGWTVE